MTNDEVPYKKEYLRAWKKLKKAPAWYTLPRSAHFTLAKQRFLEHASRMKDKSFKKPLQELGKEQDEEIADAINYEIFKIIKKMIE